MNTVKNISSKPIKTTLGNVCSGKETAFIGQCGCGPEHELYLIGYECIIEAFNPQKRTWKDLDCNVTVDRFVDIEIVVIEKCNAET